MNLLRAPTSADPMIRRYSTGSHYKTYEGERDASVTTNCNVLEALCVSPNVSGHLHEIEVIMGFLCQTWWRDRGAIRDKWVSTQFALYSPHHTRICSVPAINKLEKNVSSYYPVMSIAQALTRALNLWTREMLPGLPLKLLEDALVVLLQELLLLLQAQAEDGSWEGKQESTSYALIALNTISSLPMVDSVKPIMHQVEVAARNGRTRLLKYLSDSRPHRSEHLWIEKVTYGSSYVSRAFALAALKCTFPSALSCQSPDATNRFYDLLPGPMDVILKAANFFERLPMFSNMPQWCMQVSLIEGSLFKRRLRDTCLEVFPQATSTKEKHLSFIPFTWTAGNNLAHGPLGSDVMFSMMVISALAYQVDEFVETEVATLSMKALAALKASIRGLSTDIEAENGDGTAWSDLTDASTHFCCHGSGAHHIDRVGGRASEGNTEAPGNVHKIHHTLKRFIGHLLDTPYARSSNDYNFAQLKCSIYDFLVAHVTQTEESRRLTPLDRDETYTMKTLQNPRSSLFTWTRTTSSDHTAGPFAVSAFICMLESMRGNVRDPLPSPQSKYVAQDVSRHLAGLCRLYNDLGSVARDLAENNLNSINFPEFTVTFDTERTHPVSHGGMQTSNATPEEHFVQVAKQKLLGIAEYERRCLNAAMAELSDLVAEDVFKALKVFCASADMYSQMYMLEDLTPAVTRT